MNVITLKISLEDVRNRILKKNEQDNIILTEDKNNDAKNPQDIRICCVHRI